MAIFGVDDFKSKLRGGGARNNLFNATINFPLYAQGDTELTSFLCKAAQLPGSSTAYIDVPFRGRQLKVAGDRTFEPWSITVINDTDMSIRDSFERWLNGINAHSANVGFTNPVDYQADLIIDQLDKDSSIIKRYNLRGCFPTTLDAIELSYDATNQIEEFRVEFQMQYWEADTTT